jgi:hypothetical protein
MTTPLGEMFMFSIEGDALTLAEKRDLLDWTIRPALRSVPGVADVNALGGYVTTFEVMPDNAAWPPSASRSRLRRPSSQQPQRRRRAADEGEEVLLVRSRGRHPDPGRPGRDRGRRRCAEQPVRVADVAEVRLGADPLRRRHPQRRAARRSRGWCSGCAAPTRARWSRASGQARRARRRPAGGRRRSTSSTTAACWWTRPCTP